MYCASTTPYMIVISRLIVGVSIGASSSVISMLTRAVEPKERTTLLSRILSGRQTGVVFGPSLNFFLVYFDFNFLSFKINKYTAPGVSICELDMVSWKQLCPNLQQNRKYSQIPSSVKLYL